MYNDTQSKTFFIGKSGEAKVFVKISNENTPSDDDILIKQWSDFTEEMPIYIIKENITHPRGAALALNWLDALQLYLRARK